MNGLLQDVRQAARAFTGRPGLSLAAVATLALGIGASTAIFSAVDAVLIHPLPYADQDRLVVMWQTDPVKGTPLIEVSYPEYESWRDRAQSFSGLAAMTATNFRVNLTGRGEPMQVEAEAVSAVFFDLLGIRPAPGRSFRADEDREGASPVAIIGHGLWQRHYGSDPGIVGSSITADGTAVTVVGVAPPDVSHRSQFRRVASPRARFRSAQRAHGSHQPSRKVHVSPGPNRVLRPAPGKDEGDPRRRVGFHGPAPAPRGPDRMGLRVHGRGPVTGRAAPESPVQLRGPRARTISGRCGFR